MKPFIYQPGKDKKRHATGRVCQYLRILLVILIIPALFCLTGCAIGQSGASRPNIFVASPSANVQKIAVMPFSAATELIGVSVSYVGSLLVADGVIGGSVDEYGMAASDGRIYALVGISMRMIDCKTRKVVCSVVQAAKASFSSTPLAVHAQGGCTGGAHGAYAAMRPVGT